MTHRPRVVVVTGASSGIGRATAALAAEMGDHVVLAARGHRSLEHVGDQCRSVGAASVLVVATDVGDDSAVEKLMAEATARHPQVDAVIDCAGVVAYGRTEEVPAVVFDGVLRTNLTGSVNVARHVIALMRRQQHGSLVMIGSVLGHIAAPSMTPYVISKWGVRALARQLQVENRDLPDLHISYVAPGGVDTPIYEQAANYAGHVGRPPPPVASPERIARMAIRRVEHPRARTQSGLSNNLIRFGFSAVPWAFDSLVGPLFGLSATDRTTPVEHTTGNVLTSKEDGNRLHGSAGSAVIGIGRNVVAGIIAKAGLKRPAA